MARTRDWSDVPNSGMWQNDDPKRFIVVGVSEDDVHTDYDVVADFGDEDYGYVAKFLERVWGEANIPMAHAYANFLNNKYSLGQDLTSEEYITLSKVYRDIADAERGVRTISERKIGQLSDDLFTIRNGLRIARGALNDILREWEG